MKTKTISYTKTFQVYQFVNDKISIEDTFPSTVSDEECFRQLMERVDSLGRIAYPHLYEETRLTKEFVEFSGIEAEKTINKYSTGKPIMNIYEPPPPPVIDISKEKEQPASLEDSIMSCTEIYGLDGLESYRKIVENLYITGDKEIKELFDNKLKELYK